MSQDPRGLYRVGGAAFLVSGLLFLLRAVLDLSAGEPPSTGVEILAWIASHSLVISLDSEILFFATVCLVPAVIALHRSLAPIEPVKAVTGCGIMAVVIPVLAVLLIVQGRLVYPVYGITASTPDQAALVVAVFYGGMHAVDLLMAVATIILSLAMRGEAYGKPVLPPVLRRLVPRGRIGPLPSGIGAAARRWLAPRVDQSALQARAGPDLELMPMGQLALPARPRHTAAWEPRVPAATLPNQP